MSATHCQLNRAQDADAVTKREGERKRYRERERSERKQEMVTLYCLAKNIFFYVYIIFHLPLPMTHIFYLSHLLPFSYSCSASSFMKIN